MKQSGQSGFTIIELIIVIVIIGILALLTSVLYTGAQAQSRDTKIRDGASKFAEAIQLWSAQNGNALPLGGASSATPATATGCVDGGTGFQDYGYGSIDAMVATGYLSAELFAAMPANTVLNSVKKTFMVYPCANDAKQWNLMYTLEAPTPGDTTNLNSVLTACGTNPVGYAPISTSGMRGAITIKFP